MRSVGTGPVQAAIDAALTGRTSVPGWLRELDPDAAARMASAYDTSPAGTPRDIPLTPVGFAGEWRIRRRLARLARHGGRGDGARDDRFLGMTFTTRAALDHLRAHGWVGPAPDVIDDDFRLPFDWMRWRMMSLLPAATGRYPMWLWPADGPGWRRHFRWPLRGDVLLVVDVPREEVLLSDIGDWHDVLNLAPPLPVECHVCGVRFCRRHEPPEPEVPDFGGTWYWREVSGSEVARLTPAWDDIFDPRRASEGREMQATCEVVRAEWVVAAFLAPPRRKRERW